MVSSNDNICENIAFGWKIKVNSIIKIIATKSNIKNLVDEVSNAIINKLAKKTVIQIAPSIGSSIPKKYCIRNNIKDVMKSG